ncbi:MAG TPA: CHAT domain-containing protein [Microbacterium sp.]|uniref:CHAT domain-containing protein n=1 Tax=Microbacterium sp. TaxID=51671 RepID=UPI002C715E97|nr:CHAT domain-containing protein [Microbacterium sp.]HWI31217.1 CHAT domain-containing protein [Microbacterium sp.]
MGLSAQRLYDRAVDHGNAGRNAAARRDLHAALERTDDADLRARITGTLAYIESRTGNPERAEELCREGLADPRVAESTRAILYGQLGVLALMRGQALEARELLTRALEGIDDPAGSSRMRINRSVAAMQLGDFAAARVDLEAAVGTFERLGDPVEQAKSLHNLGYVELLTGDLVRALGHMAAARPALEKLSPVAAAQCDVDRADVLRDAGLTTEAERILDRVARTFGAHGMRQARGEAELSLARSLLAHDPAGAARVARGAARRFRALGSETWAIRADGVQTRAELVPSAYGRRGEQTVVSRRPPSPERVESVAAALAHERLDAEAAAVRLAGALRFADRDSTAAPVRVPRSAPVATQLLAHEVRARRAALRGAGADVRRHCARGLDELMRRQESFGSLDLQTSTRVHSLGLMLEGLASAVRSRKPEVLFEWSERARHLSQEVIPLRPPPDPGLANDLAELRMLRAENPSGDWLSDPRAAALRDRVRQRQWSETGSAAVQQRVSLEQFRGHLDGDTALLSFVFSGDSLSCLVVSRGRAAIVDVGRWSSVRESLDGLRADLDISASVRSGPMATIVQRALGERLTRLSLVLLNEPLRAAGDVRRVILTVPGVLNGIPWAMLPAMRGRAFTVAVSATRWASLRPSADAVAADGARTAGFAVGPRVARADEEVSTAASAWPAATALRGDDATVSAVTDLASTVDVLHVASHGRHAVDNPMFSGLELADGTLFGYDIDLMPRVPDTVVLSACEVGRSSVRWGEEAIGMTRTWLHAGSRVVIAAPVVVADDIACELLGALHSGLVEGLTPSEALAVASDSTGLVAPFQAHGAGF